MWAAQVAGQEFTISTVAGGVPPPATAAPTTASIGKPEGVAVDAAGNVYFSAGYCVLKLSTSGVLTVVAGNSRRGYSGDGGPATSAQLNYPRGLAIDGAGNLYITDKVNNRIRRVSPSGTITTVAGIGAPTFGGDGGPATSAALYQPEDVAVDGAGNLYIADQMNNRIRRVSAAGIITTVAGTGDHGFSGDGGPATAAWLSWPSGVAADGAGNIYIADTENNRVRRVSPSGGIFTLATDLARPRDLAVESTGNLVVTDTGRSRVVRVQFGGVIGIVTVAGTGDAGFSGDGGLATSAQLGGPEGVAADTAGNVYIADTNNNRIRRVLRLTPFSGGTISTVAGDGTRLYSGDGGPAASAQMAEPYFVSVDASGNLYIADHGNGSVRRVSPSGTITTAAAGFPISGMSGPYGVAADGGGNLYITDGMFRVHRVSPGGTIDDVTVGAGLSAPFGLAMDASDNLYIADMGRNRVVRVSPAGAFTTVAGTGLRGYSGDGGPATLAQLREPRDVAVDGAGNLYISDTGNYRVRRVSPGGIITTVAGNGTLGFSGDGGPAVSAQLNDPLGVALDGAGSIYLADMWNHRIRRVSPSGIITTIAGTGAEGYSGDGGPAKSARLGYPTGLAVDSMGRVYFATGNAVRMLTPSCTVSATPNAWTVPVYGGSLTLTIQATAGCAWSITGLPVWITASATSGWGPATVTLTAPGNMGAHRAATITAAGTAVTITQGSGGGLCLFSISPDRQAFSSAGGAGSFTVSAGAACGWTADSQAAWITVTSGAAGSGNGTVNFQVLTNTAGARAGTIKVAGSTFTVDQLGHGLVSVGTMAQVASGGGWKTTFTLVNNGSAPALARLNFRGGTGAELILPLTFPQTGAGPLLASALERTLNAGATLVIESEGPATQDTQQGWAELLTDGAITGFAVFRQRIGDREQEAVVPLETRAVPGYVLAFDNTSGIDTGVAVANLAAQGSALSVIINDETGAHIQTHTLDLPARGHTAFALNSLYPATAGKRGTVEFRAPAGGQISVLGLRFNRGPFTTIPVWAH